MDTLKKRPREGLIFFLSASLIVAVDQLSKLWVRSNMSLGQSIPEDSIPQLTYIHNTGAAFGLLANQTFLVILTVSVGIAVIFLFYRHPLSHNMLVKTGLGLLLGGAIGNLIDRLSFGYVIDFIDFHVWPVFNLADSAITVSIAIFIYYILFIARKEGRRAT